MTLETVLAYLHLMAILSWVVFISSTAALARVEWLNAAVVDRLVRVDLIANVGGVLVLLTGLARIAWGMKGAAWYGAQPLLWAKLALMAVMLAAGWRTRVQLLGWQRQLHSGGRLPQADEIATLRQRVMRSSHLMLLLPIAGVMLARGIATVAR